MKPPPLAHAELALLVGVFQRHPEITTVKIFGSRAKGTHAPYSDVDIAIWGNVDALQAEAIAAELDELIYMRLPPGYIEPGKVLKLNKALYGLRRSPILWQTKITNAMKSLGFDEIPQEPCVMMKDGIICFYFVDDIVFAFRQRDREKVQETVEGLKKTFTIKEIGELKWFLGMHIVRDRRKRSLWISQLSYVETGRIGSFKELSRLQESPT